MKTGKILAICIVLVMLVAFIPGAMADDAGHGARGWMKSHEIERIDIVKTVTGQSDNSVMFDVPSMALMGKEGDVASVKFTTPLKGKYNATYDMGYISMMGAKSSDISVRPFDNATLNVAGASVVMTIKDIKVLLKQEDLHVFEFSKLCVYMPDGTGKEYKLDKPAKVIYSKDRKMLVVDAYPSLTNTMKSDYKVGAMFPADAPPIKVKDIASAEMAGEVIRIGYTPPMAKPLPTAVPTATPTATPTTLPPS